MYYNILDMIAFASLGFMFAKWFVPIQIVKDTFFEHWKKAFNKEFPFKYVFYCSKCTTFWGTLIYTHDIKIAAISAVLAYAIHFSINKMEWYWSEKG